MSSTPATGQPAPRFDVEVPAGGYRWWYVDGLSADGEQGIVVIAFIGSVFSPYYFRARARGPADPEQYCAINVGLYRRRARRWAMTERSAAALERGVEWFRVGPSRLDWDGDRLRIDVRERAAPFAQRLEGRIVVRPAFLNLRAFALDACALHTWQPIAPAGEIDVEFTKPAVRWHGDAYFDTNAGARALELDFERWNWSRTGGAGRTSITYAVTTTAGDERALALEFAGDGACREVDVPPVVPLEMTGWRVARETRAHSIPSVVRTLEDTPFYARSVLQSPDHDAPTMHESLSLARFRSAWVRTLLPFRMPRFASR